MKKNKSLLLVTSVVFLALAFPIMLYGVSNKHSCDLYSEIAKKEEIYGYIKDWFTNLAASDDKLIDFFSGSAQINSLVSPDRFSMLKLDLAKLNLEGREEIIVSLSRNMSDWDKDFQYTDVESINIMTGDSVLIFDINSIGKLGYVFWRDLSEKLVPFQSGKVQLYCE